MAFQKGYRKISKKALEESIDKEAQEVNIDSQKRALQSSGSIKLVKKQKKNKKRATYMLDPDVIDKLKQLAKSSEYSASGYLNELIKIQYEAEYKK